VICFGVQGGGCFSIGDKATARCSGRERARFFYWKNIIRPTYKRVEAEC